MRERPDYAAYVTERSPRLLRTAYLLCRDGGQAEDLLQTALVKAWRAWRRIGNDPDPYVYRILVNTHAPPSSSSGGSPATGRRR
ncbi:sigma factor [Actinomadura chokoriensis]|uniref:Sigma factor n=1 Tax=Actinomadura chokoriensis TaxID=454156 RepID=A0ABV4R7H6_9ACTN